MVQETIGRYKILRELGKGGMSVVYLAHDPNVGRDVALKVLPREYLVHNTFQERFYREARIIAALDHPAIVPVYDFGQDQGLPFFVMRNMQGGSLADRLRMGPVSIDVISKVLARVGSAVDFAHSKGILHRDLKPANILFDQFDEAYLSDFGIARLEETGATLTGNVYMGTPAYISPEQVQGNVDVDGRIDVYAMGVILFESLTGRKPYHAANSAALALKHITEPIPRILDEDPTLPPELDDLVKRAMAKKPDERFQNAAELTGKLSRVSTVVVQPKKSIAPTPSPEPAPVPKPTPQTGQRPEPAPEIVDSTRPTPKLKQKKKDRRPLLVVGLALIGLVCLGAVAVTLALAFGGGLVGDGDQTSTTAPTERPSDTATARPSPRATSTPETESLDAPSATPRRQISTPVLIPTLRPTFTPTPVSNQSNLAPTRAAVSTNTPAPAQPASSGGGSSGGGSSGGGSGGGGSGVGSPQPPSPTPKPQPTNTPVPARATATEPPRPPTATEPPAPTEEPPTQPPPTRTPAN